MSDQPIKPGDRVTRKTRSRGTFSKYGIVERVQANGRAYVQWSFGGAYRDQHGFIELDALELAPAAS